MLDHFRSASPGNLQPRMKVRVTAGTKHHKISCSTRAPAFRSFDDAHANHADRGRIECIASPLPVAWRSEWSASAQIEGTLDTPPPGAIVDAGTGKPGR